MNSKCTLQTCSGRASIGKTVPWSLALLLAAVAVSSALLWRPMRLHSASTPYANLNGFLPTRANINPPPNSAPEGMVWIPGGEFSMGSADPRTLPHGGGEAMDDARPIHRVYVDGLWMDKTDVTNAQFARFVKATGYKTIAERKPQPKDFPGAAATDLVPGSIVFTPPPHSVPLDDYSQWCATFRAPTGNIRLGRTAVFADASSIPSSRSLMKMPPPTRSGQEATTDRS
jgi:sulfatase modifying factor 1